MYQSFRALALTHASAIYTHTPSLPPSSLGLMQVECARLEAQVLFTVDEVVAPCPSPPWLLLSFGLQCPLSSLSLGWASSSVTPSGLLTLLVCARQDHWPHLPSCAVPAPPRKRGQRDLRREPLDGTWAEAAASGTSNGAHGPTLPPSGLASKEALLQPAAGHWVAPQEHSFVFALPVRCSMNISFCFSLQTVMFVQLS